MGGGLLNLVSYGNQNIFLNGNPKKSLFTTTYKKYTNFGLQKHIINCNLTNVNLRENTPTTYDFTIPRWGDLLADSFFLINLPYIWSPVWVEPSDLSSNPGGCNSVDCGFPPGGSTDTPNCPNNCGNSGMYRISDASNSELQFPREIGSSQIPYCQPYEFKWIEDIGSQIIKKITVTIGGILIQEYSGEYLSSLVKRDFTKEKQELFNQMTGNIKELYDPAYAGKRNGLYPNCIFAADSTYRDASDNIYWALYNNLSEIDINNLNIKSNLNPSINKRLLCIPLNLWYMFSSSQAFPLVGLTQNSLKINIECRPIRELFKVRDVRSFINNYYNHNFALGNVLSTGSGSSIYEYYDPDYYKNGNINFSQFNIFKPYVPPPYISTIDTTDPLYQMYMFTTQYACTNQAFIQQAALETTESANVSAYLRPTSLWDANPRLVSTYVYLEEEEQRVFRFRPQSYLFKQIQEISFLKTNHKKFVTERFKSNNIVASWRWYLQRSDVNFRNEWNNYTNWDYIDEKSYNLQKLYHTELSNNWIGDFPNSPVTAVWETKTLTTANPDPNFNRNPEIFQTVTGSTMPENFRENIYSKDFSYNNIICQARDFGGIEVGSVYVGPGMKRNLPYFPYTWTNNDLSLNGMWPYITGPVRNLQRDIMKQWGLTIDGKIREDTIEADYYNLVEPFLRSSGGWSRGVYNYSFCLNTNPYIMDPNGGANLINFRHIDYEYSNVDLLEIRDISRVAIIPLCQETINNELTPISYNKIDWQLYDYQFDLKIFEEHFNLLTISDGLASLEFISHR
jgi:hypothetical protein